MLGVEPTKRQVPHHAPYAIEFRVLAAPTNFAPDAIQLSFFVKAPDGIQFIVQGLRKQSTVGMTCISVADNVNHNVY